MALSRTTRTHLIYQFIILTLLFLGMSYNEFFPDRKFTFLALIPMFLYQLLILSCCTELIPLPGWMNFSALKHFTSKESVQETPQSSPLAAFVSRGLADSKTTMVVNKCNIGEWNPNPKLSGFQPLKTPPSKAKRAKSWGNLRDSKSNISKQKDDTLRKGSVENLTTLDKQDETNGTVDATSKNSRVSSNFRCETAFRSRSWKIKTAEVEQFPCPTNPTMVQNSIEASSGPSCIEGEESEFTKSYSFPFRQKRLGKWIETKGNETLDPIKNTSFPYWQTQGYNLAVKYEARRRRRADSGPASTSEDDKTTISYQPSAASNSPDWMNETKACPKKNLACLNKMKMGFSQFISKSRSQINVKKEKTRDSCFDVEEEQVPDVPKLPKFLSKERPVLLYPKYIPFEKDRFEKDVKKKMLELREERTTSF